MPSDLQISVVVPSYNSARWLPNTLDSILVQNVPRIEVIVVDDGSSDNTAEIVRRYSGRGVRYIHQENSGGPSRPRNVGIRHAKGRFVALFDSDDIMLPGKLRNSLRALDLVPDPAFLCTDFSVINENGELLLHSWLSKYDESFQRLPKRPLGGDVYFIEQPIARAYLVRHNFVGTSSVVIRRDLVDELGWFDETLKNGDDADMWFRIVDRHGVVFLDNPYHGYRERSGSVLRRDPRSSAPYRITVLDRRVRSEVDREHRAVLRGRISGHYNAMAEQCRGESERQAARSYYLASLRYSLNWPAFRGLILTFVPESVRQALVFFRDFLKTIQQRSRR